MTVASGTETLSIYFPKSTQEQKPYQRLQRLAKKKDRSINYLVVEAILQYLKEEQV